MAADLEAEPSDRRARPPTSPSAVPTPLPGPTGEPTSRASVRRRRARLVGAAVGLGIFAALADVVLGGPVSRGGAAGATATFVLVAAALLVIGALLSAYARAFEVSIRPAISGLATRGLAWTRRWLPNAEITADEAPPLALGDRMTLAFGLLLTALDVLLTLLLLRDVFPEAPYRFDAWGLLPASVAEWTFYLSVACFKTALELWFGMLDESRRASGEGGGAWTAIRWFALGGASAFDAALAASRGWMLAEQGIDGAGVMVSNLVFIGFGIAVPWVAARTGGLLVRAADPLLSRWGPAAIAGTAVRLLIVGLVWAVVLLAAAPPLIVLGALALVAAVWGVIEDLIGVLLAHEDAADDDAWATASRSLADPDRATPPSNGALRRAEMGGVR